MTSLPLRPTDEFLHGAHPADEILPQRLLATGSGTRPLLPAPGRHGLPSARRPPLCQRQQRQQHGAGRQGELLRRLPGGLKTKRKQEKLSGVKKRLVGERGQLPRGYDQANGRGVNSYLLCVCSHSQSLVENLAPVFNLVAGAGKQTALESGEKNTHHMSVPWSARSPGPHLRSPNFLYGAESVKHFQLSSCHNQVITELWGTWILFFYQFCFFLLFLN